MIQGCLWCLLNPWQCWLLTKSKRATEPFPLRAAPLSDHQVLRVISDHQVLHLWEQMRATEWQCVRHQTLAGHHINHSGERIGVHQGHNLPVYRSLGLHITCQLYHALGLFMACLFHVISQLQPLKVRSNIRDQKLAQAPCQKRNGLRQNIINPCFNSWCVSV